MACSIPERTVVWLVRIFAGITLIAVWAWGNQLPAADRQQVDCLEFDLPPVWIVKGELRNQGIIDRQTRLLAQQLPEYDFAEETVPWTRFQKYIEIKDRLYCNTGFINIENKNPNLYYSIPTHFTTPKTLIIKRSNKNRFGDSTTIRLEKVLQNRSLKFAHYKYRPYGDKLEAVISKYRAGKNLVEIYSTDADVISMLDKERVDYLIEYADVYLYQLKLRDESPEKYYNYIIEEEGEQGVLCAVAAVKNEQGREFIRSVNNAIRRIRGSRAFLETYLDWCPTELMSIRKTGLKELLEGAYDGKASSLD